MKDLDHCFLPELAVIVGIALELLCRVKLAVEDIEAEESALLEDLYAADRKFSEYYNVWESPSEFTPEPEIKQLWCSFRSGLGFHAVQIVVEVLSPSFSSMGSTILLQAIQVLKDVLKCLWVSGAGADFGCSSETCQGIQTSAPA